MSVLLLSGCSGESARVILPKAKVDLNESAVEKTEPVSAEKTVVKETAPWGEQSIAVDTAGLPESMPSETNLEIGQPSDAAPAKEPNRQTNDDKIKQITFDNIKLEIEAGEEYDSELLTDEIKKLDGVSVQLRGFMLPAAKQDGIKKFILVRDNLECCFGPKAAIHDCIVVVLEKDAETSFTVRPITVEGTFLLKEFRPGRDKTARPLAIYRMSDCKITR